MSCVMFPIVVLMVSHVGLTSNAFEVTMKLQTFLFQMAVTSCISVQYLWKYGFAKSSDNLYAPCTCAHTSSCDYYRADIHIIVFERVYFLWSFMWLGAWGTVWLLSARRLNNSVLDHCHYILAPFQDVSWFFLHLSSHNPLIVVFFRALCTHVVACLKHVACLLLPLWVPHLPLVYTGPHFFFPASS